MTQTSAKLNELKAGLLSKGLGLDELTEVARQLSNHRRTMENSWLAQGMDRAYETKDVWDEYVNFKGFSSQTRLNN